MHRDYGRVQGPERCHKNGGEKKRSRTVSVASLKPFYRRSSDLRHPIGDEFAQIAWGADLGLKEDSVAAAPMYTEIDRKNMVSKTGIARWECRGRYLDGVSSDWVTEAESLDSFTPLQLGTFHALRNLNPPDADRTQTTARAKQRTLLSSRETLTLYPIATTAARFHVVGDKRIDRAGQVYDFCSPYWRIRFPDNDWEELTVSGMKKGVPR